MSVSFRLLPFLLSACLAASHAAAAPTDSAGAAPARPIISVCADPQNLPFTDDHVVGFESRIAALVANDLNADLQYAWQQSDRGFLRKTLFAGACNVVIGVPSGLPGVAVTRPYYASSYVAVTRANDSRHFTSFDDAWLKDARIGVQLIDSDRSVMPPTYALALRGINRHITGFAVRTELPVPNPQGQIIDAVADGRIDIAFVWGPVAGYFARFHDGVLRIENITSDPKNPNLKFVFPTSMAVRKADTALRDRLQGAIDRHPADIAAILNNYGITMVPTPEPPGQLPIHQVAQTLGAPPPVR